MPFVLLSVVTNPAVFALSGEVFEWVIVVIKANRASRVVFEVVRFRVEGTMRLPPA